MTAPALDSGKSRGAALRDVSLLLILAGALVWLHFKSLYFGLFMDDHAHFEQLRACGWSLGGLVDACRLELVGDRFQVWFLPDCTLRFFRPIAFALMKLTYTLGGWEPLVMHAASIGWHVLVCGLLVVLLRQLGTTPWLSWGIAALFAVHPGHIATVEWLACQTELMATAFLLGATICYLQFKRRRAETGAPLHAAWLWGIATIVPFMLALGCRENAIMLPFVLFLADLLDRRLERRSLPLFALLGLVAVGYLVLRWQMLGAAALPPKPYVMPPSDPAFARFVFDKLCYYVLGEFLIAPTVPFGGLLYLRARPLLFYGVSLFVIALIVALYVRAWRRKENTLGLFWLFAFMAPVLPVFAAPHHLYLPGIGWALTASYLFGWIGTTTGRLARHRRRIMWVALTGCILAFGAATRSFVETLDVAQRVEDCIVAEIASESGQLHDGDTLYLANYPLIAYSVHYAVERQTGLRNLHFAVLTWSPNVMGLVGTDLASELNMPDDRTVDVQIAVEPYFAGSLGYLVALADPHAVPTPQEGTVLRKGLGVAVTDQRGDGIHGLRFTLDRPLSDPAVHLLWGSSQMWACEVRPEGKP